MEKCTRANERLKEKAGRFMQDYFWLILAIIAFAIIKQLMVANIRIYAGANQVHDDYMMLDMANNIVRSGWLGEYTNNILVKGAFFPWLLSIFYRIGLPYIQGVTLLYTFSCVVFIVALRPLFKTKISMFIIFLVLLFNPVSFAFQTMQRVYRNGITLTQVLIFFGCMCAIYLRRKEKCTKLILWAIGAGLGAATLWHTREDGIWIIPFLLVATIVIIVSNVLFMKASSKRNLIKRTLFFLLPIVILYASTHVISLINYHYYGVYTYNEINDSYFGSAMKSLYSVKNNEVIQYVSITREKINRLYEVSPSLKRIQPYLEGSLNAWDNNDRTPGDTQVEDGWFFWCLRDAVNAAGYYENAQTANAFYKQLSEEINQAIAEGKIEKQATMPSSLMSPWRKGYFTQLMETMGEIIQFTFNFKDKSVLNVISDYPDNIEEIGLFEVISNEDTLYPLEEGTELEFTNQMRLAHSQKYYDRLNSITLIYQKLGAPVGVIGVVTYLFILFMGIKKIKIKENVYSDAALILTGILSSLLVLFGGVAYNHIASCNSILYLYLSGSYPLLIAFSFISICICIENSRFMSKKLSNT